MDDLGLGSWSPGLLYTFGLLLLGAALADRFPRWLGERTTVLAAAAAGALAYEFLQMGMEQRSFAWSDVLATLAGALLALLAARVFRPRER